MTHADEHKAHLMICTPDLADQLTQRLAADREEVCHDSRRCYEQALQETRSGQSTNTVLTVKIERYTDSMHVGEFKWSERSLRVSVPGTVRL